MVEFCDRVQLQCFHFSRTASPFSILMCPPVSLPHNMCVCVLSAAACLEWSDGAECELHERHHSPGSVQPPGHTAARGGSQGEGREGKGEHQRQAYDTRHLVKKANVSAS